MTTERKIVVGVDGSAESVEALRWAVQQANLTGAKLEAIGAWEPPNMAEMSPALGVAPPVAQEMSSSKTALDMARRQLDQAIDAATVGGEAQISATVVEGHPAPVLVQAAEGADLLVVGSSGHGAFVGMLLGSVTSHVCAHAPCPVVIVRGPQSRGSVGR